MKRIVILGAGFGGVYALRELHDLFHGEEVHFTVVNRENYFLFTPLLHEVATGGLSAHTIVEPLRQVFDCCGLDLKIGTADRIRLADRTVETSAGDVPYDALVIALGAETNYYGVSGAADHALGLKNIRDALAVKRRMIDVFDAAAPGSKPRFAVVGGGPTGVELAAEMAEFVHDALTKLYRGIKIAPEIVLLQQGDDLLPNFQPFMRSKAKETLEKKGVDVLLKTAVTSVEADGVTLAGGHRLETAMTVWVAGVRPAELDFDAPVERARDGRLSVEPTLMLKGHPGVFVIGDQASFMQDGAPLPPFAQVATHQSSAVAVNVRHFLKQEPLEPFRYRHSGNLISLGQWMAMAEIGPFRFWGHLAWWMWRTTYLFKFISFRKKFVIALQWTINLVSPRDTSKL